MQQFKFECCSDNWYSNDFSSRNQKGGEPYDVFLMEIKKLARNCLFNDEDDMIRDICSYTHSDATVSTTIMNTHQSYFAFICVNCCVISSFVR